jgi:hypothetical protein
MYLYLSNTKVGNIIHVWEMTCRRASGTAVRYALTNDRRESWVPESCCLLHAPSSILDPVRTLDRGEPALYR